jgi:hypothetical protein
MPPGLKAQIFFAVIITIGALLVLPIALSAQQSASSASSAKTVASLSAGNVTTTLQEFYAGDFAAAEFSDWD